MKLNKQLSILVIFLSINTLFAQEVCHLKITYPGNVDEHGLRLSVPDQKLIIEPFGSMLFEGEMNLSEPTFAMLINKKNRIAAIWLEPGNIEVEVLSTSKIPSLKVVGSQSHDIYTKLVTAKKENRFADEFAKYSSSEVALDYINGEYQFMKLSNDEFRKVHSLISKEDSEKVKEFNAFIATLDIKKVKKNGRIHDFVALDSEGNAFDTKNYRGKYLLIDFAATWCGPCWMSFSHMIEKSAIYDDLQIITFNHDEDKSGWVKTAERRNLSIDWPVLWDAENKEEIFHIYNIEGYPTYVLIDPKGKVVERWDFASEVVLTKKLKKHLK